MSVIRDIKKEWDSKVPFLQNKVSKLYGTEEISHNPFLNSDGGIFNKYLDHQAVLDNPAVSAKTKQFISAATGLTPNMPDSVNLQSEVALPHHHTGNSLADTAQQYLGTPYVWGGESLEEGGMDCSGFVYNALKDAGYNVGRTTAQGYRSYGQSVGKADMLPGDLVFFGKDNAASHIGIYLGNGQMIHSSGGRKNTRSNPGKGVTISNIDSRSDFIEARRY
jgi:cell wall-associated NlpC family hydrolase